MGHYDKNADYDDAKGDIALANEAGNDLDLIVGGHS